MQSKPEHSPQESLGSPKSLTVPASRLLSYLPSLSSQAYASSGLLGCHATVKVGDSHWISQSFSPTARTHNNHQSDGKHDSSSHEHFRMCLLTRLYFSDVNEMILRGWRQHFPIMTETKRPHRPVESVAGFKILWNVISCNVKIRRMCLSATNYNEGTLSINHCAYTKFTK